LIEMDKSQFQAAKVSRKHRLEKSMSKFFPQLMNY